MTNIKNRREFLKYSLNAGLCLPLISSGLYSLSSQSSNFIKSVPTKKLKILILGGTSFLGPHQVAYALNRGHSVSTFTRGKTLPSVHAGLFSQVEQLIGDRKDNLTALHNRKWDVVIDNSGRDVQWTRDTAELLKDNCGIYIYTSSTGVYYPYFTENYTESDKVLMKLDIDVEEEIKFIYDYGIMKANSEIEAIKHFGKDRTIVVRPTYMIGPADKSNRFIHWPIRLSRDGEVLIPGKSTDRVQYIDVRDVAEWMIRLAENKQAGTYNAVGPSESQTMQAFIDQAQNAFDVNSTFIKIDDYDFLMANDIYYIVPWIIGLEDNVGSAKVSNKKAKENGLTFRPIVESVKDTYDWWYSEALDQSFRDKVEKDPNSILNREKDIIKKWRSYKSSK